MLTKKTTPTINVQDDKLSRIQDNITHTLDPVLQTEIIDGVLLVNLVIPASGFLVVPHGLGRRARGYIVVAANAAYSPPYAPVASQTSPNNAVMLQFSTGAGATISIWVF